LGTFLVAFLGVEAPDPTPPQSFLSALAKGEEGAEWSVL
jgi:hypothetical protein